MKGRLDIVTQTFLYCRQDNNILHDKYLKLPSMFQSANCTRE